MCRCLAAAGATTPQPQRRPRGCQRRTCSPAMGPSCLIPLWPPAATPAAIAANLCCRARCCSCSPALPLSMLHHRSSPVRPPVAAMAPQMRWDLKQGERGGI
uniref:Uncharacterized protein n=1 Tax=Arundo donax TaxID=35708 RepID=A0A0A9ADZ9_ARUDO